MLHYGSGSSKIPISDPNPCPTFKVVFSLQLGLGALTTFASYNKYEHRLLMYFFVTNFFCGLLIFASTAH